MPLDAVCLSALIRELRPQVQGARIDKITQPGRDEVILALRGAGGSCRLLLSASSAHPRAGLVQLPRENPLQPPMFCMLLRKHLTGARILELSQPPMERVLRLRLEALNELGDRVERSLVLEAMNRHANLILLDENGRIVDCLRRVDPEMSPTRPVLPGLFYQLPPAQAGKRNPLLLSWEELTAFTEQAPAEAELTALLLDSFVGLSPLICRELSLRAGGAVDARLSQLSAEQRQELPKLLWSFFRGIEEGNFSPVLLSREGRPRDFSYTPILQYGTAMESSRAESFSQLLEQFYAKKEAGERVRQIGQGLLKSLSNARDRTARRVQNQGLELEKAMNREALRQKGDILTSNLYRMKKGMGQLCAENFFEPDCPPITIPLDPLLSPQQNAARYYREYNKAKTAQQVLTVQLEKGRAELEYLESVLQAVRMMEGERDLAVIQEELEATGYLSAKKKKGKKSPNTDSAKPREFRSSAGLTIYVGRNNLQNDRITFKLSRSTDYWFHAQHYHGSHVLLCTGGEEPDDRSVEEAAMLAAYYSQAREGQKVPVDYAPVRNVKKRPNGKPGMVLYNVYRTAIVTPQPEQAEKLRIR